MWAFVHRVCSLDVMAGCTLTAARHAFWLREDVGVILLVAIRTSQTSPDRTDACALIVNWRSERLVEDTA